MRGAFGRLMESTILSGDPLKAIVWVAVGRLMSLIPFGVPCSLVSLA